MSLTLQEDHRSTVKSPGSLQLPVQALRNASINCGKSVL